MSSTLDFKLVKKGTKCTEAPIIMWFDTTRAREFANALSLAYDAYTQTNLQEFVAYCNQVIRQDKDMLCEYQNDMNRYQEIMTYASTKTAYEEAENDFYEARSSYRYIETEIKDYEKLLHNFCFMEEIIDLNQNYEFYYYFC